MAMRADGTWQDEDASVSTRLNGMLANNNPLMQASRTRGAQFAQRRGMLNSTMAGEATERAMIDAALPIASQEAAQAHQRNLQGSQERIAKMNIASNDREKAASMAAAMENTYGELFRTIAQAHELPADVRDRYLEHSASLRNSQLSLVEQMYGIDLQWSTPSVKDAPAAPAGAKTTQPVSTPRAVTPGAPSGANDKWWLDVIGP